VKGPRVRLGYLSRGPSS